MIVSRVVSTLYVASGFVSQARLHQASRLNDKLRGKKSEGFDVVFPSHSSRCDTVCHSEVLTQSLVTFDSCSSSESDYDTITVTVTVAEIILLGPGIG